MKRLALILIVLVAPPLFAIERNDRSHPRGTRIGILVSDQSRGRNERSVDRLMPRYICNELRKMGFDARVVNRSYEQLERNGTTTTDDVLVDFVPQDANDRQIVGIGSGGRVGNVGVGGEVSIVVTQLFGELRLLDAKTLGTVRSIPLEARRVSPALTSLGLGGRYGYIYVPIPFHRWALFRSASRQIARDAAVTIAENLEP